MVNQFQALYSACRHYFQKPPNRIVHLSNLYSAKEWTLHMVEFCALTFTQLSEFLFRAVIYWFSYAIVMHMWPLDHMLYASNCPIDGIWVPSWSAYHPIGALNKPSLDVSKSLQKDLGSFQKTAASFVIRSVLVSLLFIHGHLT